MELLNGHDPQDRVSRVLRRVRVRSTVYCRSVLSAAWGFGVEARGHPAFHVVTAGTCWLEVAGHSEQLELHAGDLVVLPSGERHWMRDAPDSPAPGLEEILATAALDAHLRLRHGGAGRRTTLLCGGFTLADGDPQSTLRTLPAVVHVRGNGGHPVPWLDAVLALLDAEMTSGAAGAEEVITRIADILLTKARRTALAEPGAADRPRVGATDDAEVAAALELIDQHPARPWTVERLASEVALSRSAFAARFREHVGETPKRYITRTRLNHAAALLDRTDAPVAAIAATVGYATEFSFSKAFKHAFGVAPGGYRRSTESPHRHESLAVELRAMRWPPEKARPTSEPPPAPAKWEPSAA